MKYLKSLAIGILVLGSNVVIAQGKGAYLGFEGGIGGSTLIEKNTSNPNNSPILGFSGGINFQYKLSKKWSIKSNLSFERKGYQSEINSSSDLPGSDFYYKIHRDYVFLPILVKRNLGKKGIFFVNAGPYVGYLVHGSSAYSRFGKPEIGSMISYPVENEKRFDLGATLGVGAEIPLNNKTTINFELRNSIGLKNIGSPPANTDYKYFNNTTLFVFGFAFRLGDKSVEE